MELIRPIDPGALMERVRRGGGGALVSDDGRVAALAERCARALERMGVHGTAPLGGWSVPGRVEVLGKHTDYLGGPSLLAAVERSVVVLVSPRADSLVRVEDARHGQHVHFHAGPDLSPPLGHWGNYPMTVARRLCRNFPGGQLGADIAFASDLPMAAGMSSSSALVTATLLALLSASGLAEKPLVRGWLRTREDVAELAAAVESGSAFRDLPGDDGVGTHGGSEDHTAMLCARPDAVVEYTFGPIRLRRALPLPGDLRFVIGSTGVRAEKTGAARERYNRVAMLGRELVRRWREDTGRVGDTLASALEDDPAAIERMRRLARVPSSSGSGAELAERLEHFVVESRQVLPAAAAALERGDLEAFGALVDRSQHAAERLLHNQVPQTERLQRLAREEGAAAASAFGAGFGGAVWALVPASDSADFLRRWSARYREAFPEQAAAEFFLTRAGDPAVRLF